MRIEVKDLPPKLQEQVWRKVIKQDQQRKREPLPSPSLAEGQKASKYHNRHTERVAPSGTVIRFDSQWEARRYDNLMAWQKTGEIKDLRLQVDFTLQEAYTDTEGRRVRAIRYRADFTYLRRLMGREGHTWTLVVEDVKSRGTRTKDYLLKRKLMKERFGIDIVEV